MQKKMFIASEGFERVYSRERAKGHTSLEIDGNINSGDFISIETEDKKLVIKSDDVECKESDDVAYTILCREFGLVGYKEKFESKLSVIFLDSGWMLVTLFKGAFVVNIDGKLLMPSAGVDSCPTVYQDMILWVDADRLLSFSKYEEIKSNFYYDLELMYILKGGAGSFSHRRIGAEDIDLSLGALALYEQKLKMRQEAKQAKTINNMFSNDKKSAYDFDEDDETEWDDEDEYDESDLDEEDDDLYEDW